MVVLPMLTRYVWSLSNKTVRSYDVNREYGKLRDNIIKCLLVGTLASYRNNDSNTGATRIVYSRPGACSKT